MIAPLRMLALSCLLGALSAAGCALPAFTKATPPVAAVPAGLEITYKTGSDRLNVQAGALSAVGLPARPQPLPNLSQSTLRIRLPHPSGRPDHGQATLHAYVDAADGSVGFGSVAGPLGGRTTVGVWVLDIPAWQVQALQRRLQEEHFFRRSRVLNAEVEIGVREGDRRFRKPFRAVAELDALLLRVAAEGRPLVSQRLPSHPTADRPFASPPAAHPGPVGQGLQRLPQTQSAAEQASAGRLPAPAR